MRGYAGKRGRNDPPCGAGHHGRQDAARWDGLAEQARLDLPPPYRPHPGEPVYEIAADERVAQVAEGDLIGPLRELVRAVLTDGWQIS